jgi:hypothetical protein
LGQAMGEAMGHGLSKRSPLEALVAPLIPSACREEVLGDLHERNPTGDCNVYLRDAILTVPLVIASRIRRTSDLRQLSMYAVVLYFSFFAAAWSDARQLIYADGGLWRLAIPCAAALLAMVLDDTYASTARTRYARLLRGPMFAIAAAVVSQGVLRAASSGLVLPLAIVLHGCTSGLVWTLLIRSRVQPPSRPRRGQA